MGNFEKLSVLVIVVIIVMILVVALYTWTGEPEATGTQGPMDTIAPVVVLPPNQLPAPPTTGTTGFPSVPPPPVIPNLPPIAAMGDSVITPVDPPATPPAAEKPADNVVAARKYTIQNGDTLGGISTKIYGTRRYVADIERANPGIDANRLRVKQVIDLPEIRLVASAARSESRGGEASTTTGSGPKAGATYTVRRGDTLPGIAKSAWGNIERWPELLCVNYEIIENPDRLSAGTRLRIPR